jgi:hypothetical protein
VTARKWKDCQYSDAASSRHGLMVCNVCNKPIAEGEYRIRETEDAYITQHRACSEHDPNWEVRDRQRANREAQAERLAVAARAFIAEWGLVDLNDYADEAQP